MEKEKEWGNFLPYSISLFTYNESITNEYMPLSKKEALEQGFRWRDDILNTTGQENCLYEELPKDPDKYTDKELLSKILKCEISLTV